MFKVDNSFNIGQPSSSDSDITDKTSHKNTSLRFLHIEEIFDEINDIVKHVAELTELPFSTSRILLNHFKWDKNFLFTMYYERTDDDEFFQKYRVVNPVRALDISSENTTDECRICFKASKGIEGEITGSLCGHKFCNTCWDQYLSTKITNEGLGETISCPQYQCNIILEDAFITGMLTDPAIKLMYKRLVAHNFVQLKQDWCWCPSPKCDLAIEVLKIDAVAICQCGERFCHKCFDDWHAPVECEYLKLWKSDDSATLVYLTARTKQCPSCSSNIEKNGGCNHMTCRTCSYQFCWICLCKWSLHNSCHKCNKYKNKNIDRARAQSNRLNHYWNRYSEHKISLQFEQALCDKVNKVNKAKNIKMSAKEVECFQKGVFELLECRRMLMNTYVFIYYLEDDRDEDKVLSKTIFEENQADLEAATERLSGLLQNYYKPDSNLESINRKCENIIAIYGYCETRRKVLLEHVEEGNEKMFWRYRR